MIVEDTSAAPVARRSGIAPIWLGAAALFQLTLGTVIMLSYTVLNLEWQQQWGSVNSWVGAAVQVSAVIPLRLWSTSSTKD